MLDKHRILVILRRYETILSELIQHDGETPPLMLKYIHLHTMIHRIIELLVREEYIAVVHHIHFIQGALYFDDKLSLGQINDDIRYMRKETEESSESENGDKSDGTRS